MDLGSVLLAGALATVGAALVHALLRDEPRDALMVLGSRASNDPLTAYAAGIVAHATVGLAWAVAFAVAWSVTGWPIAPTQGMLFGLARWALAERRLRSPSRTARESGASLAAHVAYGALLGLSYRPGQ